MNPVIGRAAKTPAEESVDFEIPPLIQRSQEAFRRDLPQLLLKRLGQWVAYHAEERIGFSRCQHDLYEECFRKGLARGQFVVRCVAPEGPDTIAAEELMDV